MILVTGATGLVGSHLLYHLTNESNANIRALYRDENKRQEIKNIFAFYTKEAEKLFSKIEWIKADITDIPSLIPAFENIKWVYHCAALVSFNPKDYKKMRQVNIYGTANIVNLCIDNNINKLCYVSSIATIGSATNKKEKVTEENEWNHQEKNSDYAITKYGAEIEIWRASQEGIDVIIVNPGVILGNGFWNNNSGKIFANIYNGLSFYTKGITGFISVKDTVKAMVLLMNSNIKNKRFILISENLSYKKLFFLIADAFNKKKPTYKIGKIGTSIFWRLNWLFSKITKKEPLLTKNSAKASHNKTLYSSEKIKKALNFEFEPIEKTIKEICKNYSA